MSASLESKYATKPGCVDIVIDGPDKISDDTEASGKEGALSARRAFGAHRLQFNLLAGRLVSIGSHVREDPSIGKIE